MFSLSKVEAQVVNVNPRKEAHGDEWVSAIDVKLKLTNVDISNIGLDGCPKPAQGYSIKAHHKVENVTAEIGKVVLRAADVKGIEVTSVTDGLCALTLTVQGQCSYTQTADLHRALREMIELSILERQLSLATG